MADYKENERFCTFISVVSTYFYQNYLISHIYAIDELFNYYAN